MADHTTKPFDAIAHSIPMAPLNTLGLVIAWSQSEPERVGEIFLLPPRDFGEWGIGRSISTTETKIEMVGALRHRPSQSLMDLQPNGQPLSSPHLSRLQLRITPRGVDHLWVHNNGSIHLRHNGHPFTKGMVQPGDCLELIGAYLLLCVRRPKVLPSFPGLHLHPFGAADRDKMIGESPASWKLREHTHQLAMGEEHVLVLGPSGSGKEAAGRAIHRYSSKTKSLLAINGAQLNSELGFTEFVGVHPRHISSDHPGSEGLLKRSHGSSLLLDEIGEMDHRVQATLLRVMDNGNYSPYGSPQELWTDVRLIAMTNRKPEDLKHDLAHRFTQLLTVPDLKERREDIPLLVRRILEDKGETRPASAALIEALLRAEKYPGQVRGLISLLHRAARNSPSEEILPPKDGLFSSGDTFESVAVPPLPTQNLRPPPLLVDGGGPLSWADWGDLLGLRHHGFDTRKAGLAGGIASDTGKVNNRLKSLLLLIWVDEVGDAEVAAQLVAGPSAPPALIEQLRLVLEEQLKGMEAHFRDQPDPVAIWSKYYQKSIKGIRLKQLAPHIAALLQRR